MTNRKPNILVKVSESGYANAVYDIVTDETRVYCYQPESKRQSAQLIFQNEVKPAKVKKARSVDKKMLATFFRFSGHVIALPLEERLL